LIISQAFLLYEKDKKIQGYSPKTLTAYRLQANLLIRYFGDVDINTITYEKLKDYLSKDYERLKPSSIGHRVRFLKSLYRWALDEGYIDINPASKLKEPKEGSKIPKLLTREEVEILKSACKKPIEHALIRILYATGSRIGEIHKLNKNDIDFENRVIVVNGKSDKERKVFFNAECKIWIHNYLKFRNDDCEALFVTERNPKRRSSIAQLRYVVKRVAKRAGMNISVYPHRFRHSLASHMFEKGAPLDFVQHILGHTKSDITKRFYIHTNTEMSRQLYDRFY